jgi:hypothetical protein
VHNSRKAAFVRAACIRALEMGERKSQASYRTQPLSFLKTLFYISAGGLFTPSPFSSSLSLVDYIIDLIELQRHKVQPRLMPEQRVWMSLYIYIFIFYKYMHSGIFTEKMAALSYRRKPLSSHSLRCKLSGNHPIRLALLLQLILVNSTSPRVRLCRWKERRMLPCYNAWWCNALVNMRFEIILL